MNLHLKAATVVAAIAAALAVTATAHANRFEADADCDRMVFDMPSTETNTQVLVTRNGQIVADVRNDTFGEAVRFSIPSPDQTVRQTWRVVVIGYNGTLRWSETVEPCVTPTTSTAPTTSTTSTVPPTTMIPPPAIPTPEVSVAPPPVPSSSTVVTTPRPSTPSTTTPDRSGWVLPDTGPDNGDLLGGAGVLTCFGLAFWCLSRARRG